jgi:hypothetical protein
LLFSLYCPICMGPGGMVFKGGGDYKLINSPML